MLEVISNLIHHVITVDNLEAGKKSVETFFDILTERFRDSNSFVRVKLLNVLSKLSE
jgi:condensin complex subunit 1